MNVPQPKAVEAGPLDREAEAGVGPAESQGLVVASPDPTPRSLSASTVSNSPRVIHHHEFLIMLQTTLSFLVGALFVMTFLVQPYRIPSASMENTLLVGDFLLVNKAIFANPGPWGRLMPYEPVDRDDVVVFHYPADDSMYLVKRAIAVPGDKVHLHDGRVFVNGRQQREPFALYIASYPSPFRDDFPAAHTIDPAAGAAWRAEMKRDVQRGELVVPPGDYFVLGDNRNDSLDSRYWGFVPRQNIVGEPFLVYFSIASASSSEMSGSLDDRLPQGRTRWDRLVGSVRWYRIFHVIH